MKTAKSFLSWFFFVGVMTFWMLQVHNKSQVNEEMLHQKLSKIDSKIIKLESEIAQLSLLDNN
jgi:cell division protein FtsB